MLLPLAYNQVWTWVIILLVVVLLFGATKLPALSKSLGQSIRIFRKEVKTEGSAKDDEAPASDAARAESDAGTTTGTTTDKS